MVFVLPHDSLARRYSEAYRQVTWEGFGDLLVRRLYP